jgi:hypothetical protein
MTESKSPSAPEAGELARIIAADVDNFVALCERSMAARRRLKTVCDGYASLLQKLEETEQERKSAQNACDSWQALYLAAVNAQRDLQAKLAETEKRLAEARQYALKPFVASEDCLAQAVRNLNDIARVTDEALRSAATSGKDK